MVRNQQNQGFIPTIDSILGLRLEFSCLNNKNLLSIEALIMA